MEDKLLKRKKKAVGNNAQLAIICTDLAEYYAANSKYLLALREYESVAKIYKNEHKQIQYAQINRGIGEAYMGLHDFDNALKHFNIYKEIAVEISNGLEEQRALAQLGHMYLTWYLEFVSDDTVVKQKRKLNKAYEYFVQSLRKCESLTTSKAEKQDMLARLLSNLGIVKENLGEYEKALELFQKSIKICREFDLYEQLFRGSMSLAALLDKLDKCTESIQNYNLAIEVAKKLGDTKTELICVALLGKAEVLIKSADFFSAKHILHKAFKLKSPNLQERKVIENKLKIVTVLCRTEDKLIALCNDNTELKSMYDKMGDGCCLLKNYTKAIEYYKKMLETAEKLGVSEKELSNCYHSLAETYKDNNQYKEAVEYFEKEYLLYDNSLNDKLNTLCCIADTKESGGAHLFDVKGVYERAVADSVKFHNEKEEKRILQRLKEYLERANAPHSQLAIIESRLNRLSYIDAAESEDILTSEDEHSEDSQMTSRFFEDVNLSDLTDVSSESENETICASSAVGKRKRQKTTRFSVNEKGEWPLHRACIKNELKVIQHLVDSGHPINVRDNCGWLPLHEAASHGYVEAVRILLDHGASINDRGGAQCEGTTPMHDSAINGHLEVVQLLLDRGASPLAKNDKGDTALHVLKNWYRLNAPLDEQNESLYQKLVKTQSDALERTGQRVNERPKREVSVTPEKRNVQYRSPEKVARLRRSVDVGDDRVWTQENSPDNAASDYQKVMKSLRTKNLSEITHTSAYVTEKRPALISVKNDALSDDDDWLEDDLGNSRKKKRRLDRCSPMKPTFERKRSRNSVCTEDSGSLDNFEDNDLLYINEFQCIPNITSSTTPNSKTIQKRPSSSFSRSSSSEAMDITRKLKAPQKKLTQLGLTRTTIEAADSTSTQLSQACIESSLKSIEVPQAMQMVVNDPTLFVDVEIEGKLYRVPVLMSQIPTKTIKWVADEAASRYASKHFKRPILELETSNGAALADEDKVALVFPGGSMRAEQIIGRVLRWIVPPLTEKYKEVCVQMSLAPIEDISKLVEEMSITLDISDRGFMSNELSPLLKSINNEENISELNLSGNFLNSDTIKLLAQSLVTLPHLTSLNLSCTGLQIAHIACMVDILSGNTVCNKLCTLDLSDNKMLGNKSVNYLATLTRLFPLKQLNVCNVGFTENAFNDNSLTLHLEELQLFDVSDNKLGLQDFSKLLSWINFTRITSLNISKNCSGIAELLINMIQNGGTNNSLKNLNVSRCGIRDWEAYDVMRLLPGLTYLDLSYNPVTRIIKSTLAKINLMGCKIENY